MKRKALLFASALAMLMVLIAVDSFAQGFRLMRVDTSAYPKMTGYFYARSAMGEPIVDIKTSDIEVKENDITIDPSKVQIDCSLLAAETPMSVMLLTDFTASMNESVSPTEKRKDWIIAGIRYFLDSLKFNKPTEVYILPFSTVLFSGTGWKGTKTEVTNWIDKSMPLFQGLTNFNPPFLDPTGNIFELMKNKPIEYPKICIMVTDGYHEQKTKFEWQQILQKLKDNNIVLFVIAVQPPITADQTLSDLYYMANQTGGRAVEALSKADVLKHYTKIINEMQGRRQCRITWPISSACGENNRNRNMSITLKKDLEFPVTSLLTYKAPVTSMSTLNFDSPKYLFGAQGLGKTEQDLTITAQNADFSITEFNFSPANDFEVVSDNLPFTITKNTSKKIKLKYKKSPADDPTDYSFTIKTNQCDIPPVTLVAPCGASVENKVDMPETVEGKKSTKTFTNIIKNETSVAISGDVKLSGTDANLFSIKSGAGKFTLNPGEGLDLEVEFAPSSVGAKKATIDFTIANAAVCGNVTAEINGTSIINSIEEDLSKYGAYISEVAPNPATNVARLSIHSETAKFFDVELYNSVGQLVAKLYSDMIVGDKEIIVNTDLFNSGSYMIVAKTDNVTFTKIMNISK